ncbi:MAG: helix-turn-helix domain-containing protein [Treponema sp.]|nr:helix-turn-helix domain-containing protein [Treponema sp.]
MDTTGSRIYHPTKPMDRRNLDLEILFVLEGELVIHAGPELRRSKPSDIVVFNPQGEFGRAAAGPMRLSPLGDCLFLLVRIGIPFLASVFGDAVPLFDCDSTIQDKDFSVLRNALAEIASANAAGSENGLLFYSRLYRVLDELTARFVKPGTGPEGEEGDEGPRKRIIRGYIQKNFRRPVSLEELAEFLSLSPQYLSRYFKKLFGVNFHAYITRTRLENALKALIATDNPVTAIAYDSGFPNLTAFIKGMKEELGQTPAAYRRAQREGAENQGAAEEKGASPNPARIRAGLAALMDERPGPAGRKKLIIDARKGSPFARPWQEVINLGFARDIEKAEFMSQIRLIQHEAPFRYARFQGLFGKNMLSPNEKSTYHFAKIDRVIDLIREAGLLPFIELGYKPTNIAKRSGVFVFDRNDERENFPWEEYENIIAHFLKHAVNRYGMREASRWRFEYWFPADEGRHYPDEHIAAYIRQFTRIKSIIKKIIPAALTGGPGFVLFSDIESMENIIKKFDPENRPDFFSFYVFSAVRELSEFEGESGKAYLWTKDDTAKKIAWIKDCVENVRRNGGNGPGNNMKSGNANSPLSKNFYVTEWNIDFSCRSLIHDSLLKAAFILQNSIDAIDQVDVLSYWLASDISAEYTDSDAPLFGGPGLISRHGIRKPAFFAYQFLSKLGDRLLAKGDGYIVTAKSEYEFSAILFNYTYINDRFRFADQIRNMSGSISEYLADLEHRLFSLEIRNIAAGRYKLRQHILNSRSGSVYDTWLGLSAAENLQSSETAWLERTCAPGLKIDFLEGKESLTVECELEPNEVRLLELSLVLE